jgi:hypothetical protein
MAEPFDFKVHTAPYQEVGYHVTTAGGYIVWRTGTGRNVELLHIHAAMPGEGGVLLREMLRQLRARPPYATVFGFCLPHNARAKLFYLTMGFLLSPVQGVYDVGSALVFSARYDELCAKLLKEES